MRISDWSSDVCSSDLDLIYARPGQSLAAWQAELTRALGFGTEHLSLYQLTIELGKRFTTEAAAVRLTLPDDVHAAVLFAATRELTHAVGLPADEIVKPDEPGDANTHD